MQTQEDQDPNHQKKIVRFASKVINYDQIVQQLLQPACENQEQVHEYLKVLQPAIWRTVERQGTVLEKRYQSIFSALERAATNLHKYKDSLNKLKDSIEKSDSIQKTLVDVKNFKSYSQLLTSDIQKLEKDIAEKQERCKILNQIVKQKHKDLNSKNTENLQLLREINKQRKNLKNLNEAIKNSNHTKFAQIETQDPKMKEKLNILSQVQQENKYLQQLMKKKCNSYNQEIALFDDCLKVFKNQLEKSQRVVNTKKGLQGSLLFEMKKAELFLTESEGQMRTSRSGLQGREVRNIVHDTLKNMLEAKEGKRVSYLKDFKIEWDVYKQFNPIQLLGVMSLKPKVFEQLKQILQQKVRKLNNLNEIKFQIQH